MSTTEVGLDLQRVKEFARQLLTFYTGGAVTLMVDLGCRLRLFEAAGRRPASSTEIARRAGLDEREVREWLGAMTTAGIFTYDAASDTYLLPAEHAACLTGETPFNLAPMSQLAAHHASVLPKVVEAFRDGRGVPYREYGPAFTELTDAIGRRRYDAMLVDSYLTTSGLTERLRAGIEVADIGCGSGHCVTLMAAAFPASNFAGYDIDEEGIARARAEASRLGLRNARFEVLDIAQLPPEPKLDLVTAFDVIHDQARPDTVLRRVHAALNQDGTFFMFDIRGSSNLEENVGKATAPWLYSMSVLHCLQVSLAEGGPGLGTMWGEQVARHMLEAAGFRNVETAKPPMDPFNLIYVCRP